jgi:hypothetical protein
VPAIEGFAVKERLEPLFVMGGVAEGGSAQNN